MPKFFVTQDQVQNGTIYVIGEDVNHIKNVLRMKIHDKLTICIKETKEDALCQIQEVQENSIICKILDMSKNQVESNIKVSIFQGLPKSDKMELIIQKSVELGVYDIYPVKMKRCVVKLEKKDEQKKIARWQKISEVAAKQCGRGIVPEVKQIVTISDICNKIPKYDIVLVAYEGETENSLKSELTKLTKAYINNQKTDIKSEKMDIKIAVVIGPEGGLDISEVKQMNESGAKIVTLGKRILRTETVAFNVLSNIMYELEQ